MSSKVLLGGAVTVAAGYALYEYQLQRQQQRGTLAYPQQHDSSKFEKKGGQVGSKLDDIRDDARDQLSRWKSEADKKLTSTMSDIEHSKAKGSQWVGEQLGEARDAVTEKRDRYLERSGELNAMVEADRDKNKPNKLVQLVNDARDTISTDIRNIREGVTEDAGSIKEALVGARKSTEEYGEEAKDRASSLGDAVSARADEAKKTLQDAGSAARQKADQAAATVSDTKESIFNWGFSKAEKAKAIAIGEYDEANKRYNELLEKHKSQKGLFSKGDEDLKRQVDVAHEKVLECKRKLDDASSRYAQYTNDNINELSDKLDKQDQQIRKDGFFKWLSGGSQNSTPTDADKVAAKSVAGWGENAEQLAREELDELVRNNQIGPSEAQRRLDEWKKIRKEGWFSHRGKNDEEVAARAAKALEGWGETASQMARDEYEDLKSSAPKDASDAVEKAKQKLDDAKKQLDETASSWWSFGKEKKNDLHEKAQQQYDQAEKEYRSTVDKLAAWSDKAKGKFWSTADSALDATKSGADSLHSKTKEGLDSAQEFVQDKKN